MHAKYFMHNLLRIVPIVSWILTVLVDLKSLGSVKTLM